MPNRKLDETRNMVALFRHVMGDTDVPSIWLDWAMLSTIASAVANRVHLDVYRGSPTYPNLYVWLIGQSSIGKGLVIEKAVSFVSNNASVNLFAGQATAEHLQKVMEPRGQSTTTATDAARPVFLLQEELKSGLGEGENARRMVTLLTELFTGRSYVWRHGTITRGEVKFKSACINWLAGTTIEWLNEVVRKGDIAGGFMARIVPVVPMNIPPQKARPTYPDDYDEVMGHLQDRFDMLAQLEGDFYMTDRAWGIHRTWVEERPPVADPILEPTRRRHREIALKLGMILALADTELTGVPDLVIDPRHIIQAQKLLGNAEKTVAYIARKTGETLDTAGLSVVEEFIQKQGTVLRSRLTEFAYRHGIGSPRLRELLSMLQQSGKIDMITQLNYTVIKWKKRKVAP